MTSSIAFAQRKFNSLVSLSEHFLLDGKLDAAAAVAGVAARYGFTDHVGAFASPRLEHVLRSLGAVPRAKDSIVRPCGMHKVTHVLTYARPIGGDTRYVYRWIRRDPDHRHSVVVNRPAESNFPEALATAVARSGGELTMLATHWSRPIQQAAELRTAVSGADIVFLHLFPDDIAPLIALANPGATPKVAYVHHSDHTFWMGAGISKVVVNLRDQNREFVLRRRGLNPENSTLLPIPIDCAARSLPKAEAKRRLGYSPETLVLLSIASSFKFDSIDGTGFLQFVLPIVEKHRNCVLLVVGPADSGDWCNAKILTDGRVVALGRRWDTDELYDAADVYLDSIPFSSVTSMIEAGSRGIPVLGYLPRESDPWLIGPGAPGLTSAMLTADDRESYHQLLSRLLHEATFREASGARIRQSVSDQHSGDGWLNHLDRLYRILEDDSDRHYGAEMPVPRVVEDRLDLALHELMRRISVGIGPVIDAYASPLKYGTRLRVLLGLIRVRLGFSYSLLLPPCLEKIVGGRAPAIGRFLRKVLERNDDLDWESAARKAKGRREVPRWRR